MSGSDPWFAARRRRVRYRLGFVRRRSALALVAEANRWEAAYRRERDENERLAVELSRIARHPHGGILVNIAGAALNRRPANSQTQAHE